MVALLKQEPRSQCLNDGELFFARFRHGTRQALRHPNMVFSISVVTLHSEAAGNEVAAGDPQVGIPLSESCSWHPLSLSSCRPSLLVSFYCQTSQGATNRQQSGRPASSRRLFLRSEARTTVFAEDYNLRPLSTSSDDVYLKNIRYSASCRYG